MAFLAPLFLGLAALVGVPLLVHLLQRRIGRVVDFPAVRYLARMEKEHSRELKLRHRLLLLLRLLAVIALALAAARPIARLAGLGHAPIALVIVLDNSMSTGAIVDGKPVLQSLLTDARALVGSLAADDRAWIITADGHVTGGGAPALLSLLSATHSLAGRGDLPTAVRRAIALARGGAPRSPVVALLTDGQANALGAATDSSIVANDIPIVMHAPHRAPLRNHAVVAATSTPARWAPSGTLTFAITSPDSTPWRVTLDGRTVARGQAAAGDEMHPTVLSTRVSSATEGWVRGTVELDADELRGDDIRHFAARVAPPPTVDVRSEAGTFAAAALGTLIDDGRLARAGTTAAAAASPAVTVTGAESPGGTRPALLFAPTDPVRVSDANRTLARLAVPWRFGAVLRDSVTVRRRARGSGPAGSEAVLEGTRVSQRYPLLVALDAPREAARAETLAVAGNALWMVAGAGYVLVGSPLTPNATDLPLRAGFVPWLLDVVGRRLGDDGRLLTAVPGGLVNRVDDVTALEAPDGTLRTVSGPAITAPVDPGVYFLRRGTARVGALVVNPEPEESDLRQGGPSLTERFSGRAVSEEADARKWRERVLEQASGRSLLLPMIAIALVALLLEAWLARVGGSTPRGEAKVSGLAARARAA